MLSNVWKVLLLISLLVLASNGAAQAERRTALVIGNGAYSTMGVLRNPGNDARKIGARLRELGFELVGGEPYVDVRQTQLTTIVSTFAQRAQGADAVVFYYSGHGAEVAGVNYLFSTDGGRVTADRVIEQIDATNARIKIVLLDACRDDPAETARSAGFTAAATPAGVGILIGYATQPRATASDGPAGQNSPYASAFLEALESKGLDVWPFFNQVAFGTMRRTGNKQRPWITASPIGSLFHFNPSNATGNLATSAAQSDPTAPECGVCLGRHRTPPSRGSV